MSFTDRFPKSSLRVAGYAFTMAAWAITVVGSSTGGCISDPGGFQPTTSSSSSGSGSGGAGGAAVNLGAEMFEELKADFIDECGSCHKIGGSADTPFLGDVEGGSDDTYEAVTSWPGIIVADPQLSVLIRWPADGSHSGPPPSAGLETALLACLPEEPKPAAGSRTPKKPIPPSNRTCPASTRSISTRWAPTSWAWP